MAEESREAHDHQEMTEPNHKNRAEEDHKKHRESGGGKAYRRYTPKNRRLALCACVLIFLLLAGLAVLIGWLIYRPQKPQFTVTGAAIYALNATTSPSLVSATMQFTVFTRNPNKRVSILYDQLVAFVSYKNQKITPPVVLPPLFHEKHTTVAFSPLLGGGGGDGAVAVPVEVSNGLVMEEAYGVVGLRVVLLGKMRWKAGGIWTGRYGIRVKCDVLLGLKNGYVGQVPLLRSPQCKVN